MRNPIKDSFETVIDLFDDYRDYRSEKKEIRRTKFKETEELRDIIKPDTEANSEFRDDVMKYAGRLFLVGNIRQDVRGRFQRAEESVRAIKNQFDSEALDAIYLNMAISEKNNETRSDIFYESTGSVFAAANSNGLTAYYGPTLTSHIGFSERDIQKTIKAAESSKQIRDLGRTAIVTVVSAMEASRHPINDQHDLRLSYDQLVDGGVLMLDKPESGQGNTSWTNIYKPENQII
ncbi:MAG: hypothetical protein WCF91_00200 [bacterium]